MTLSLERSIALLVVALFPSVANTQPARLVLPGVVVEEIAKGSAGENAGLRPDDVLLGWERPANPPANPEKAEGTIESVFDWMWLEIEQGPRGMVRVTGERSGKAMTFDVPIGEWRVKVRPRLEREPLDTYADGKAAVRSKQLEAGIARWNDLGRVAEAAGNIDLVSWVKLLIGETWFEAQRYREAEAAYDSARQAAEKDTNLVPDGFIWHAIGWNVHRQKRLHEAEQAYKYVLAIREQTPGSAVSVARALNQVEAVANQRADLTAAEQYARRAMSILEKVAPHSPDLAAALVKLGGIANQHGDLGTAETFYQRALAIQEKFAPDSLNLSGVLASLGTVAHQRGELTTASGYHKRALEIRERRAPDTLYVAVSMGQLGNVAWSSGELATADDYYRRSLSLLEKFWPDSLPLAGILNNLANVAWIRGDLVTAEAYYKRAVGIQERLAPNHLDLSMTLGNLGNVAWSRREPATAEAYYKRALAIDEKLAPDSLRVATDLNNLGRVTRDRGDLVASESYHTRALALQESLAPKRAADSLSDLGDLARARRDLATAESYYQRALTMREQLAPGGLESADVLSSLANLAFLRGQFVVAQAYHRRALAIRERLGAGSVAEAESLYDLARVYRVGGETVAARDHFRRAIDAFETQSGKLGGSQETQSGFRAQFIDYYRDYIDLLLELNQPAEAFDVLERSRARTLIAMLAERDLIFTADVPEETERERRKIAREYDQIQAKLTQSNPLKEPAQVEAALSQIRELRNRQSDIVEQIRQQSPRFASLQYPQPLDVKATQAALDRGTLLLSYSVHKEKSYLFAVTADSGIQVYTLGSGETQLREEVEQFRSLIQRAQAGAKDLSGLVDHGKHLYERLILPATKSIERAKRVLLVPDGPLHVLPFAALVRAVDAKGSRAARDWQYFVEWRPLHVVVSATVYAELRKKPQSRGGKEPGRTVIAFGDPQYPVIAANEAEKGLDTQEAVVRSVLTRYRLTPLPATRNEVAAIANLYREKADIYVGGTATEERAKSVAKDTKYLHFASHGLLDERFPLNSGLALTIPVERKEGQDNGILQAWEIFERVRIDADLVVLSACETALGKEMGGEGLVGVTRAFQYAGARSVLASLWSVADETTAALMKQFYGYLKAGRSKDSALRQAQLDLIRGSVAVHQQEQATKVDISHPFYWAAFQLNGGWR